MKGSILIELCDNGFVTTATAPDQAPARTIHTSTNDLFAWLKDTLPTWPAPDIPKGRVN